MKKIIAVFIVLIFVTGCAVNLARNIDDSALNYFDYSLSDYLVQGERANRVFTLAFGLYNDIANADKIEMVAK
ncbi:hypothetical protein KCM76_24780 [Zooshikella marina]|uniref:hypothetical protein n=1 Tax=Zooshikella ganghwensis TaxID=202772 RepID=UPI001BAFC235|nr:hypothetical protein [Zooshikella ganghwensis]MBU2709234.1 hypothetical protein [Zooshikella ganghwensis]